MHWLPGAEDALWRRNEMCEISLKSVSSSSAPPAPPHTPYPQFTDMKEPQCYSLWHQWLKPGFTRRFLIVLNWEKKKQTKKKTENCGIYVVKMWQCVAFCMWDEVSRTFHCKIWSVSGFFPSQSYFKSQSMLLKPLNATMKWPRFHWVALCNKMKCIRLS